jgi:hypothetical protein
MRLVHFSFPANGPWGDEATQAMSDLAKTIAEEPGIVWKVWLENKEEGTAGGSYLFEDRTSADAYIAKHTARLGQFGVSEVNVESFDVQEDLSKLCLFKR